MLEPYTNAMKEKVNSESITSIMQMKTWLTQEYAIEVEPSWLFRFCKKNSVFPIKKLE
ncbi:MAG: hypothetical protein HYV41_02240 [Candidatus Magasanikbacteria bacterium]|nr:hypothetical protein [Candidatus Magasanikbacteria bacterium]